MPFAATQIDLEFTLLSNVSEKEKNKHHITLPICGKKKKIQMNLFTKYKSHRYRKQTYSSQRGKVGARDKLGVWD